MHKGTSGLRARAKRLPCRREGVAPKPKNAVIPPPYRLRDQNGYERAGLQGHHGHAHGLWCRCTAGFGRHSLGVHGAWRAKIAGKKTVTLRTQIARAPGRPATGRITTGAGSDARRDTCGRCLVPADEARPPRTGAAWPPSMAPARPPQLHSEARVPLAARNCSSLAKVRPGSDGAEVGYGSAKRKCGVGGMDEVWTRYGPILGGDRFNRIDLCELSAPGARGRVWIIKLPSDLKLQRSHNFRVGDLVFWRRPSGNPAQPSAGNTLRS